MDGRHLTPIQFQLEFLYAYRLSCFNALSGLVSPISPIELNPILSRSDLL